jgi:hypothetical protein
MLETLSKLPPAQLLFLTGAIAAFSTFGASLSIVHLWNNLPDRKR